VNEVNKGITNITISLCKIKVLLSDQWGDRSNYTAYDEKY